MPIKTENISAAIKRRFMKQCGLGNPASVKDPADNNYDQAALNAAGTSTVEVWRVDADDEVRLAGACIAPQRLSIKFNINANASIASKHFFIAPFACRIHSIKEVHAVAGSDASAVTGYVVKVPNGTAAASGTSVMSGTFNLKGTAETPQEATLASNYGYIDLAENDRLAFITSGTLTNLAGVVLTVEMSPGGKSNIAIYDGLTIADQAFFVANRPTIIKSIKYVHSALGTDAGAVNVQVEKVTGTTAVGSGTNLLTNNTNAGFDCKGAINTVQEGSLSATAANLRLAAGDRLAVNFAGTTTALANPLVVVEMEPYHDSIDVSFNIQANAALADQSFWVSDGKYKVLAISEVHGTLGTDVSAVNLQVTHQKATEDAASGTNLLTNNTNAGFDLKGTVNTVQLGTLVADGSLYVLENDRLGVDFAGTLTAVAGLSLTVTLQRL